MADAVTSPITATAKKAPTEAEAEVLRKVCHVVAQAPTDLPSLSPDLLRRAARAASLTLPEEGVLEMWLAREKQQASEKAEITPTKVQTAADSMLEATVVSADGQRRAKYRLVGGLPFMNDFEKSAVPTYANLPSQLTFASHLVLTEPGLAIICFNRGEVLSDAVTNIRLFLGTLGGPHEADWVEEKLVKPLIEVFTQISNIMVGFEAKMTTAKHWEELIRVIDPCLRLMYRIWTEIFKKRRRAGLFAGETFTEEAPVYGAWLPKVIKEYDTHAAGGTGRGRGGGGGGRGGGRNPHRPAPSNDVCFRCGGPGHQSRNCDKNQADAASSLASAKEKNPWLFKRKRN